jgi:hypothetical protein
MDTIQDTDRGFSALLDDRQLRLLAPLPALVFVFLKPRCQVLKHPDEVLHRAEHFLVIAIERYLSADDGTQRPCVLFPHPRAVVKHERLVGKGLIDENWQPLAWDKRQSGKYAVVLAEFARQGIGLEWANVRLE